MFGGTDFREVAIVGLTLGKSPQGQESVSSVRYCSAQLISYSTALHVSVHQTVTSKGDEWNTFRWQERERICQFGQGLVNCLRVMRSIATPSLALVVLHVRPCWSWRCYCPGSAIGKTDSSET